MPINGDIILSTFTISAQILVIFLLACLVLRKTSFGKTVLQFFSKNALLFAFLVALFATCGSLFFSEIMKYDPCKLCWYQRIFMYPQAILLGIALFKKEAQVIKKYIIPLCIIGALIGVYHYSMQVNSAIAASYGVCTAIGAESCAAAPFFYYGYITIPMMAFTGFVLILFLMLIRK